MSNAFLFDCHVLFDVEHLQGTVGHPSYATLNLNTDVGSITLK